jgi:hypothetical protein
MTSKQNLYWKRVWWNIKNLRVGDKNHHNPWNPQRKAGTSRGRNARQDFFHALMDFPAYHWLRNKFRYENPVKWAVICFVGFMFAAGLVYTVLRAIFE